MEQLGKPETIEALKLVLSKIDVLAFAVKAFDGFLQRGDTIADNIGDSLGDLRKISAGIDFEKIRTVASKLPPVLDAGTVVVDSGMLDPNTVKLLAEAGKIAASSYIETQAAPRKDIKGIFELLGALKDPRIQHAMGFFMEFMKRYSEKMK